jgi:predicted DNA repair protein MutK
MASGFFALLDDIAAIMDDIAVMSKVAAKKTAGILGDDLAVNAEKASGFASARELPVLWAITKGSLLNKAIILPIAFLLSAFFPVAIIVILVLGGLFLAYEGAEKIYEFIFPHPHKETHVTEENFTDAQILEAEKGKIKSAIVTDFILSVEIVIMALGTVIGKPLLQQMIVVSLIALAATIGVYGIVALIVRMDEAGFRLIHISKRKNGFLEVIGKLLVQALPKVIKALTVIGTIALLLVSGGIFVHYIPFFHHLVPSIPLPSIVKELVIGLLLGIIVLGIVNLSKKLFVRK